MNGLLEISGPSIETLQSFIYLPLETAQVENKIIGIGIQFCDRVIKENFIYSVPSSCDGDHRPGKRLCNMYHVTSNSIRGVQPPTSHIFTRKSSVTVHTTYKYQLTTENSYTGEI
jgi:hypothetical protein